MSVTHLAAPHVTISGRTVQRCCICGEKLLDSLGTSAPLNPDGTEPDFPTWATGTLIRFSGQQPQAQVRVGSWDEVETALPADLCLALVE